MPNQHTYQPMRLAGRRYAEAGGRFALAEAERRYPGHDKSHDAFIEGFDGAVELANGTTLDQRIGAHEQGYAYADSGGREYDHESWRLFPHLSDAGDCELRRHFRLGYHDWRDHKAEDRREADAKRKREREAAARDEAATLYWECCTRDCIGEGLKVGGRLHRVMDAAWCAEAAEDEDRPGNADDLMSYKEFWIHAW